MVKRSIAKVLVLMPPPVEPGEAPINIRIISKKAEKLVKLAMFKVLNPAVLAVIDWKKAPNNFPFKDKPFKTPSLSPINRKRAPITINKKLVIKTNLV
jgi:hypothetical protein